MADYFADLAVKLFMNPTVDDVANALRAEREAGAADMRELEAALTKIKDAHLGDCPAGQTELAHAASHIIYMRGIAHAALAARSLPLTTPKET